MTTETFAVTETLALSGPPMWIPQMDVFLNHWFTRYEDARAYLQHHGGYLLPYGFQYFVTPAGGVRALGLDPNDPDWQRIGFDWARPADLEAWERLRLKRQIAA